MNHTNHNAAFDRPLKLALIIPTLDQGGAEKQLMLLATRIDRAKFEPHVITLTRSGPYQQELKQANVPCHSIEKRGKFDPFALRKLNALLRQIKPDIVHTWIFAANAYGRYAALRAKIPVILGGERCVDPWKSGCPNGIESTTTSSISREEALRRLKLTSDSRIIGAVGRLWPQKGYKDLIWTSSMINVVRPNMHLVIIGEGPQREILEQYRDNIGANKSVHLVGHRDDVADLMPHMDIFWNGSLYEGQSNSIMEAMQAGVPVAATDIPGNRDLIVHNESGFLYPHASPNELAKLTFQCLDDRSVRDRITSNAKERITCMFSVEQMVQKHEEYYTKCALSTSLWT